MSALQSILDKTKNLPSISSTVGRLYELLASDTAGAAAIARAIEPDAAVTANLLRIANSAAFGVSRNVSSVRQSVTLLGPGRLVDAVVSSAFRTVLPRRLPGYGIDAAAFWKHSIAVALLAERLGKQLRVADIERVFSAGLLHDIGKLAMAPELEARAEAVRAALEQGQQSFAEIEHAVIGAGHDEVGAALAHRWSLPEEIVLAARWHHHPRPPGEEGHHAVVDLVHIADGLAHLLGYGADIGELARDIDASCTTRLGLCNKTLERVASEAIDPIAELSELFASSDAKPRQRPHRGRGN
ncbi:MAG: HDOD domain-containing protein [Myxococcales bacterium]|nr:HDOD domain-containing protein [Myxococcales bacterium]